MNKKIKFFTGITLVIAVVLGCLNIFAKQKLTNEEPLQQTGSFVQTTGLNYIDNLNLGTGEKQEVQNPNSPSPLGTTTAFKGSSVTAANTVAGKEMDFKIYGHPNFDGGLKIEASQPTVYMVPVGTSYIDTQFVPDEDTTLELYFMLPNSFSIPSAHVTAVGACGTQPYHFGTGFLINNTQIQHLYGSWDANAPMLAARPQNGSGTPYLWKRGEQYYSKLAVGNGKATASVSQLGDNGWVAAEQTLTAPLRANINTQPFNSLFIFGQNNGNMVNHFNGGISEVIISKTSTGAVLKHFVAVEAGSTEYLPTPASTNCMVQLIGPAPTYVASYGDFTIQEGNTSTEIDLSIFNLSGNTYTRGSEASGNADYLHVDTKAGIVKWYQLGGSELEVTEANRAALINRGYTYSQVTSMLEIAQQLLALETTAGKTALSNNQGAWMEGIIGPVVNYTVSGTNVTPVTINVANYYKGIPQSVVAEDLSVVGMVNATIWKAGASSKEFLIAPGSQTRVSKPVELLLFSSDYILQLATHTGGNNYALRVDVVFNTSDMTTVKVVVEGANGMVVPSDMKVRIGGVQYTLDEAMEGGLIITGAASFITGEFNDVLYKFVAYNTGGADSSNGGNPTVSLTPPNTNTIVLTYKIEPRQYGVQILGKYTNRAEFDLDNALINAYEGDPVYFDSQEAMRINMTTLDETFRRIGLLFNESYMRFEESFAYDFSHFEYANGEWVDTELVLSASVLTNGIKEGAIDPSEDLFTIYAIYQKTFVLNVSFTFPGENYANLGTYRLDSDTRTKFQGTVNGIEVSNGFLVADGDAVAVILQPDRRYEVAGTYQWQLLEDNPNILFVRMDQSNNIVISLKHRNVKVNYGVEIKGAVSETMLPAPRYFSDGTAGNLLQSHTYISVEDVAPTTLLPNDAELSYRRNRADGFFIRDIRNQSELVLVPLTDGILDLSGNNSEDFFEQHVDSTGNAYVYLRVVQQNFVNFFTRGFDLTDSTSRTLTYTNDELGSYTVTLNKDLSIVNGEYWVDYGTEVTITHTTNKYGKFVNYTGLSQDENDTVTDGSITFTITRDRTVGINIDSTKLPMWISIAIIGAGVLVIIFSGLAIILGVRSSNLKKQKLQKEKELKDLKRRFNIADEIAKMREGDFGAREQR